MLMIAWQGPPNLGPKHHDTRDEDLTDVVRRRDKAIDALEAQINEDAARLIPRRPPRDDRRLVLAVIKILALLERVGDYAKTVA